MSKQAIGAGTLAFILCSAGCGGSNNVPASPEISPASGSLSITVDGLPAEAPASIVVSGPNNFTAAVISSQNLASLPPGSYTVVAGTVTAGNANYYPSSTSQTATVATGSTAAIQVGYPLAVPISTKVVDQASAQSLVVSSDGSTLTLPSSTSTGQSVSVGDVLAIGVTSSTPHGALLKVTSVNRTGSQTTASVTQATLVDAFQKANFTFQTTLNPSDFQNAQALLPGVRVSTVREGRKARATGSAFSNVTANPCAGAAVTFVRMIDVPIVQDGDGSIKANGELRLCPTLTFNWSIGGFPPALQNLSSAVTFGGSFHINITGRHSTSFEQRVPFFETTSTPITVFVGPVPVVLTPKLTLFVGADGELGGGVSAGVLQAATVTAGISYANGQVSPLFSNSSEFGTDSLGMDATFSSKALAGATIALEVYGVLVPEFSPAAYLKFEVAPFDNPWWSLSAGLEGTGRVNVRILGANLFAMEFPTLFDFSRNLAQANSGFSSSVAAPVLSAISPSTTAAGSSNLTVTLSGSNFVPGSTASVNGTPLSTSFLNPTTLTAVIPATGLLFGGSFPVRVNNPTFNTTSASLAFTVTGNTTPSGWEQSVIATSNLGYPNGIAVDLNGTVYVADYFGGSPDDPTIFNIPAVVKVNTQGIQSTVSTSGINSPNGIAVDSDGSVYIADSQHNRIVKLTSQGAQSVVVQLGQEPFSTPYSVAVDGQRNVYAVIGNRAIIKVTPSGQQSTVVSIGSEPKPNAFLSDAIAVDSVGNVYAFYNQASLVRYNPQGQQMTLSSVTSEFSYGLAVDFQGNVFFGTQSAVQRRSTSGSVTTVVGGLNGPGGIVVDGNANVYIADTENKRILKMRPF